MLAGRLARLAVDVDAQLRELLPHLLHGEAPGCFDPMPLGPRQRPPAIPGRTDLARRDGYFYMADCYVGTGMERIPRGTVRSLRVVESPEKRFWTGTAWNGSGTQAPGMVFRLCAELGVPVRRVWR